MRVYNDCNLLTYSRGMKDTDNNYYLLRIKDFLCDLFFSIFNGKNNEKNQIGLITMQDVFIMMHLLTETGKIWITIRNYDNRNDISKKIECILNYLKIKPNDMCIFVNQDLEYYNYLIDYFDFYLDKFAKEIKNEQEKIDIIIENKKIDNPKIENNNDIEENDNDKDNKNHIILNSNNEDNNLTQNQNNSNNEERNNPTKSKKISNIIDNNKNQNINIEEKSQNLLGILYLLNNIYFRSEHEKTKHLILNIIKIINDLEEDVEKQIEILNAFYNLKYKENLN